MPTKQTKIKIYTLIVINLIVWGCYLFAVVQIKMGEGKITALENEMKDNLRRQETVFVLSKNLTDTKSDRQKMADFVIQKESEVYFIKSLETLVNDNNLKSEIKSVKIEPLTSSVASEQLVIDLDVIGSWSDIMAFENFLEEMPLAVSIDSFSLSKFNTYFVKDSQITQWLGSFTLRVAKMKE